MSFLGRIFGRSKSAPEVAPSTRQVTPSARRMYQAAQVNRLTADWLVTITSANAEILVSRKAVIACTQQLERDNPHFRKILRIHKNNVIGHRGIQLQNKAKDSNGNLDRDANAAVMDGWKKYSRQEFCTVSRNLSCLEVQKLAIYALVRDGGILFRKYRGFNNAFKYAIEPIDIARLDHDYNMPVDGIQNRVQFGIEYDKFGAPVAYHILTRHPGDVFAGETGPRYRERVPADEIIALWSPERPGQFVGMPLVTSILNRLNILDKYDQAEAMAAYIASCKGGFLETKNDSGDYVGEDDGGGNTISEIQPGMVEELPVNMTYKANDPTHPTDAYPYFVKTQLRAVASGAGVPYHDMANDLEGVNYSSIRSGMLEAREDYKDLQELVKDKLMTPWFEDWLPYSIMSGQVALPIGKIDKFNAPEWKGRRWPWVDPMKDVQADILAVEAKLTSRTRVISENEDGGEIEQVFQELEDEAGLAELHDIDLTPADQAVKPVIQSGPEDGNGNAVPGQK